MLKVESLDVAYGEIRALKGVGLAVGQGEIVTILDAAPRPSPLIATSDVKLLLERFNTATMPA